MSHPFRLVILLLHFKCCCGWEERRDVAGVCPPTAGVGDEINRKVFKVVPRLSVTGREQELKHEEKPSADVGQIMFLLLEMRLADTKVSSALLQNVRDTSYGQKSSSFCSHNVLIQPFV